MKLFKPLLFIYLLAFIFILFYKINYHFNSKIIFYHLLMVTITMVLLLAIGLFFVYIKSKWNTIIFSIINALLWCIFIFSLCFCYVFCVVGKVFLGTPMTFKIGWEYLKNFNDSVTSLGFSQSQAYVVCFFILIIFLGLFSYLHRTIFDGIIEFKENLIQLYRFSLRIRIALSFAIFLGIFFITVFFFKIDVGFNLEKYREPITCTMFQQYYQGITLLDYKEPKMVRENYPKNISFCKKNVILIIVDALRADKLSMYNKAEHSNPFLQKLMNEKKLQKNKFTFSTSASSFTGILSTLRSKSSYNFSVSNFSIYELLKDQGYRINFIISGDHTNFYDLKSFYGKSVDSYYDGLDSKKYFFNDDALLMEGLNKVSTYSEPSFFYFHLMSVHAMGLKHTAFSKSKPANASFDKILYTNNYKNGILQADYFIQQIWNELEKKGYLKNSIVVITADHGESLGERGCYAHGQNVYNEEIRIPLLVYNSDTAIHYFKSNFAVQADIAPTIITSLGLPIPATWEGVSLLNNDSINNRFTYHSIKNLYAIINYRNGNIFKYCYNSFSNTEELFELNSDENETKNLIHQFDIKYINVMRVKMKSFILLHGNK